jgi:hypothetical protein
LSVLHLSDIHVDFAYRPGSLVACSAPLCCREGQPGQYFVYLSNYRNWLYSVFSQLLVMQVLVSGKFSQYGRKSVVTRDPELLKVKKHGTHMALLFQKYSYSFHDAAILKSLCLTHLFIE